MDDLVISDEKKEVEDKKEVDEEKVYDKKEEELKEILMNYSYSYDIPKDKDIIPKIFDMFKNKVIDESCDDDDYLTYKGFFYNSIKNDDKLMIKNYNLAIKKGNVHAMFNLAQYYESKKEYNEMKKLFLMAIEKGDIESTVSLGHFYYRKKKYDDMKKYLEIAIEKGNSEAMIYLAAYYEELKNMDEAIKYYNMAIEKKNYQAYIELAIHYENEDNYEEAKKYYILYLENEEDKNTKILTLLQLINFVIGKNEDAEFLRPYYILYEIDTSIIDEYKIRQNQRLQFMINKKKFVKNDTCNVCYDEKELIIYDCFAHYICEDCYHREEIVKCPYCNIPKHQIMLNNINEDDEDEDEDDEDDADDEDDEDDDDSNNEETFLDTDEESIEINSDNEIELTANKRDEEEI